MFKYRTTVQMTQKELALTTCQYRSSQFTTNYSNSNPIKGDTKRGVHSDDPSEEPHD